MAIALAILLLAWNQGTAVAYGGDFTCFFQHDLSKNSKAEGGQFPNSLDIVPPSKKEVARSDVRSSYDTTKMQVESMQAELGKMRQFVEESVASNVKQSALNDQRRNQLRLNAAEMEKKRQSLKAEEERLASEKQGFESERAKLDEGVSAQEKDLRNQIEVLNSSNTQRESELQAQKKELFGTLNAIRRETNQLTFRDQKAHKRMNQYPGLLDQIDKRIEDIKDKIGTLEERIEEERKKKIDLTARIPKLEREVSALQSNRDSASKRFDQIQSDWQVASDGVQEGKLSLNKQRAKLEQQRGSLKMLMDENIDLTQTNTFLQTKADKNVANVNSLEERAKSLNNQIGKLVPEVERLQAENQRLKDVMRADTQQLLDLQQTETNGYQNAINAVHQTSADVKEVFDAMLQKVDSVKNLSPEAGSGM